LLASRSFEILFDGRLSDCQPPSLVVTETEGFGKRRFQGPDPPETALQFQVLSIYPVSEQKEDRGTHEFGILRSRLWDVSEASPKAAGTPFGIFLDGEGAEALHETALGTEGAEVAVGPEGQADAFQGEGVRHRSYGLNDSSRAKLRREARIGIGIYLEQTKSGDVEAQSLEIALVQKGVREIGDGKLFFHVLPLATRLTPIVSGN
jgi:hypothetical protein